MVKLLDLGGGLSGRFGRQSQSSGGVLGRFDGGVVSYEIFPQLKIGGVFGYPVVSSDDRAFDTDKHFYGARGGNRTRTRLPSQDFKYCLYHSHPFPESS